MKGLSDEDGTGDAKVLFAGDEAGAAEVGGCSNALEDGGEGHEGLWVREGKIVHAGCDGGGTSCHE